MVIKSLWIEIASHGFQIMKLQSFLINMVYWMFVFSLLKHSKTATEKVAFFLSLTVYTNIQKNLDCLFLCYKYWFPFKQLFFQRCKKYTCPVGYQCTEVPDPDYPCCKIMQVMGTAAPTQMVIPNTNFTPPCIPQSFQPAPVMPPTTGPKPTKGK